VSNSPCHQTAPLREMVNTFPQCQRGAGLQLSWGACSSAFLAAAHRLRCASAIFFFVAGLTLRVGRSFFLVSGKLASQAGGRPRRLPRELAIPSNTAMAAVIASRSARRSNII
jgi:hypothetical protein